MYCRQCGCEIPDDAQFCVMCGTPVLGMPVVRLSPEPAPQPAPPPATAPGEEQAGNGREPFPTMCPAAPAAQEEPPSLEWEEVVAAQPPEPAPVPEEDASGEAPEPDMSVQAPVPAVDIASASQAEQAPEAPQVPEYIEAPAAPPQEPPVQVQPEREFAPPPPPFISEDKRRRRREKGVSDEAYRPKKKSGAGRVVLVLLLALLLLAGVACGLYYLGAVKGYFELPDWVPVLHQPQGEEDREASSEPGEPAPEQDAPPVPTPPADSPANGSWPEFPHVSESYLYAREDGTHVYFLPHTRTEGLSGGIYRMDSNGLNLQIVVDLAAMDASFAEGEEPRVDAFALLGDYIYFSCLMQPNRSAYFRVEKSGGDIQLLFLQENSYLVPGDGQLYFLFPEQRELGMFDPKTDVMPRTQPLELPDSLSLLPAFSVTDGGLYFGAHTDNTATYYRMDLGTGNTETVLSGELLGDAIVGPVWVGEDIFFVQQDVESAIDSWYRVGQGEEAPQRLLREDSADGDILFAARLGEYFLYQNGVNYYWSPVDNPAESSVKVTSGWQPFAVTDHWIFFPDKLVSVEERANPVMLSDAGEELLGSFGEAYTWAASLAENTPGIFGAALADAVPPDSGLPRAEPALPAADSLLDVLRGDVDHPLIMAAWTLSAMQQDSATGLELIQGISFLFSSRDAADLMAVQGTAIPSELTDAMASELFGVLPATLYDLVRTGSVPGMAMEGGSLVYQGWELGEANILSVEVYLDPMMQTDGTYIAQLELEDTNGNLTACNVLLVKNASYTVFPYRLTKIVKQ